MGIILRRRCITRPAGTSTVQFEFRCPAMTKQDEWSCGYSITLDGDLLKDGVAPGRDGIQALRRAMGFAVLDLEWNFHQLYLALNPDDLLDLCYPGAEDFPRYA